MFKRIKKISLGTALYCLILSPASFAGFMFDLDFTRDDFFGVPTPAGGGVIDLPTLSGNNTTNVELDITLVPGFSVGPISSWPFTESDIQSIAWAIASDTGVLSSLTLMLSSGLTSANINITDDSGNWTWSLGGEVGVGFGGDATSSASASVPVPATLALFGIGLAALGRLMRKKV